ncbi:MAG: BMP family ABC transporter substrate-binding protein [Firmicutes bacterium]|nr:BMP family ABC transporter substrate-binding protein [Bacillota bacterium]
MKKTKALLVVLLALVVCFAFAACGGGEEEATTDDTAAAGIAVEDIKVGVVHIGDPADGTGYSFMHDQGIVGMQEAIGLADEQIFRVLNIADTDSNAITTAIEDCIAQGCNIIFTTSYGYMDPTEALAAEYPDIYFSHATGYKSNETNFNNYFGRIYQARYLAGIAAGMKSETGKIGYVAAYGTELAETCSGINAFALGVQSVNPDAVVYVKSLNSWFDPANETAYAEALIEAGCDVITQHCDTANPQIAAEKAGVFSIGYNSDMSGDAPAANLTSAIWNWDVYYTTAVQAVIDGTWAELGNYYGGIKEGFVDVAPLTSLAAEGTQERIDAVVELLMNDEWDVFSGVALSFDENGAVVMTDADLVDNAGNVIVAAGGASVEDAVIQGSMNYFVKGVELK